ncbi:MAG: hypothetical protein U5R06_00180 [candidate division KSB1 bacterium]|nr:hypothetical protein [candidate division KSB1 bacterium]
MLFNEFSLKEGNLYDADKAIAGIQRIYASGLFEKVWIELEPVADHKVVVHIYVLEKYPRTVNIGFGYNDTEGLRGFLQITHFNFIGWGERFMPFVRLGDTSQKAGLSIVNDRLFATLLTLYNVIYYEQHALFRYDQRGRFIGQLAVNQKNLRFSGGIQPSRNWLILGGIKLTESITKENTALAIQRQRQRYGLISGQLIYDTRDDLHFRYRINVYKKGYVSTNATLTEMSNNALMLKQPIAGISFCLQIDSPVGPVSFFRGVSDDGRDNFYLSAGHQF